MKKLTVLMIILAVLALIEGISLFIFNLKVYVFVPRLAPYLLVNLTTLVLGIYGAQVIQKGKIQLKNGQSIMIIIIILFLFSPVIYAYHLPRYTFHQAQSIIQKDTGKKIINFKERTPINKSNNKFNYLIKATENNNTFLYIFNPYTGNFHIVSKNTNT